MAKAQQQTICLSTILYTLTEKEPEQNLYIKMFLLWILRLIRSAYLGSKDALYLYIDSRTFEYLKTSTIFGELHKKFSCSVRIFGVPPPKNHLEGMFWKYSLEDYTQDYYMYCDIDVLITRPIHNYLQNLAPNTLYVDVEGPLKDENYGADLLANGQEIPDDAAGLSAGKFVASSKLVRNILFAKVLQLWNSESSYYCVEQPFFNRAVYELRQNLPLSADLFKKPIVVKNNINDYTRDTCFFDLMGEPGNGPAHFEKVLNVSMLLDAGAL